ncbi:MAG: DUF2634 domain-containing protein [Muribaculaceae bacterium]|nr:DUF2634 domain-containing protein [Muribaculaceae bacterium]
MSSNYAFIPTTLTEQTAVAQTAELPVFKELAFNFETGQLKTMGGRYYYVEKNEAIKVWIWKALKSSRYTYLAYSTDYGNEIHTLIGRYLAKQLLYSELKRMIEEALLCNPYILSLTDFRVEQKGSVVTCTFEVNTVYGTTAQAYTYKE